jgi:hypothetical protein
VSLLVDDDYDVEQPLSSCNPKSMTIVMGVTLTFTDASGNTSATLDLTLMSNGSYTLSGLGGNVSGDYTGGHMHDGPIQGSVFYNGPAPNPHDASLIVFVLDGVTTLVVANRSLRKGMNGSGQWRNPPAWVKLGTDKSITWTVN